MADQRIDKMTIFQHLAMLIHYLSPRKTNASEFDQDQLEACHAFLRARITAVVSQLNKIQMIAEGRDDQEILKILREEVDESVSCTI